MPGVGPVVAAGVYEPPIADAILAWKVRGRRALTGPLAAAVAGALAAAIAAAVLPLLPAGRMVTLVPVPARRESRRRRGADVVAALAAATADRLPDAATAAALRFRPGVRRQHGLTAAQRRGNRPGTMRSVLPVSGPVVIVDDVVTTGATMREAARALRAAGSQPVAGAAIAAAQLPWSGARLGSAGG